MDAFDFTAEAELYPGRAKSPRRQPVGYKRFESAAHAIRFAMEELPEESLVGAYLEIGEMRFNSQEIQQLYERPDYPLERRQRAARTVHPADAKRVVDISSGPPRKKPARWAQS